MAPEQQIIAQYEEWIRETCSRKSSIKLEAYKVRRWWNNAMACAGLLGIFMATVSLVTLSWLFLIPSAMLSFAFFQARYYRNDINRSYLELDSLCDQRIDELIEGRDEIKREMKEECGY